MTPDQRVGRSQSEPLSEQESLGSHVETYINSFYDWIGLDEGIEVDRHRVIEFVSEVIERQNRIAETLSSSEYNVIVEREKLLRGNCRLGITHCIDGRYAIIYLGGRLVSAWSSKAGLVYFQEFERTDPATGETRISYELTSTRLTESIHKSAEDGRGLLELLLVHNTGLINPEKYDCGAMKELQTANSREYPEGTDLVQANLDLHEKSARAITAIYNERAEQVGRSGLKRVALPAAYDTKTMGIMLGYNSENRFFTTEVIKELANEISPELTRLHGEKTGTPASMNKDFTDPENLLGLETRIHHITSFLLMHAGFVQKIDSFLNAARVPDFESDGETSLGEQLTSDQIQALKFILAKQMAFQYLTGLFDEQDHAFSAHNERFQALSFDGVFPGHHDPGEQSFGASVANTEEAIDHILTQCSLMEKHGQVEPPYTLFLSEACVDPATEGVRSGILERLEKSDRGELRGHFRSLVKDKRISELIRKGKLVIVPVFTVQDTRKIAGLHDSVCSGMLPSDILPQGLVS